MHMHDFYVISKSEAGGGSLRIEIRNVNAEDWARAELGGPDGVHAGSRGDAGLSRSGKSLQGSRNRMVAGLRFPASFEL
jgi:hypothetical protein